MKINYPKFYKIGFEPFEIYNNLISLQQQETNKGIESYLRSVEISPANFIPPKDDAYHYFGCGCHSHTAKSPAEIEIDLASKKHRWPEIQKTNERHFKAIYKKGNEYYSDALALFKLPNADIIRQAIVSGTRGSEDPFEFTPAMRAGYYRIIDQWTNDLTGKDANKGVDADPMLDQMIYEQISGANEKYAKIFYDSLPDEMKAAITFQEFYHNIPPLTLLNHYAEAMRNNALQRVVTRLAHDYRDDVMLQLTSMAETGAYRLDVGRFLYKSIGEGQAWYWNRLVRSEGTLAVNVSFDYMAEQVGANYEVWSAAGGACPICSAFDGRVWNINEGPQPVSDTHPHCLCVRYPQFYTEKPVQPRWDRVSPYEQPYTPNEVANLIFNMAA